MGGGFHLHQNFEIGIDGGWNPPTKILLKMHDNTIIVPKLFIASLQMSHLRAGKTLKLMIFAFIWTYIRTFWIVGEIPPTDIPIRIIFCWCKNTNNVPIGMIFPKRTKFCKIFSKNLKKCLNIVFKI